MHRQLVHPYLRPIVFNVLGSLTCFTLPPEDSKVRILHLGYRAE